MYGGGAPPRHGRMPMFLQLRPEDFPVLGRFVDEPTEHPDFVWCDDPRPDERRPREPLPVYVPSLVELVHRLGGLENINDSMADVWSDQSVSSALLPDGAHWLDARVEVD